MERLLELRYKDSLKKISLPEKKFLKEVVKNIVKGLRPNRILLFGSHAYGTPTSDSDLDILIIKNTSLSFADRVRHVSQIIGRHIFPLDLIVLTPQEIRRRLKDFDPFLEEALTRGKVLYDKNR